MIARMSTREFFAQRLASEVPAFARVIRACPSDRLDYKPHERSAGAGALAAQLAAEMAHLAELFEKAEIHYAAGEPPVTCEEIAADFEHHASRALERVRNLDDAKWGGQARFYMGGKVAWETTVEGMAWGYLFDMVHHRGQLSAYIRPMGGKVPSIYGPSGDDNP